MGGQGNVQRNSGRRPLLSAHTLAAPLLGALALAGCVQRHPVPTPDRSAERQLAPMAAPAQLPVAAAAGPLTSPQAAAPAQAAIRQVAHLPWGTQARQIGRVLQGEQNPEGPMSLDADATGQVWILDQVNERLVRLGRQGQWHQVPAPRTAQELAIDEEGQLWVLDRLVGKQLLRLDAQTGAQLQHISLEGAGQDPWLITALQFHHGSLYGEYEHSDLRRLTGTGAALLQGRPTRDQGWLLKALRVPPDRVALAGRAPGDQAHDPPGLALQTQFPLPVAQLLELGAVDSGHLWLVADLVQLGDDGRPKERLRQAVVLDAAGKVLQRRDLCASYGPEEQLRSARLGRDGHLYNLCLTETGASIQEVLP